jgi:lipoprotein-releasing system ATP-binding protein
VIETIDIHKSFGKLKVLKGINILIKQGEVVSIVGPSGAGKTTLLQIIGTLMKQDKGSVLINNTDPIGLKEEKLAAFRNRNIGFVFQFHHLLPEFSALENVCIPALIASKKHKAAEEKANELLSFLGLSERLQHKPGELSGGEQQRVAVARALINDPMVILADEPSGNLDSKNKKELHELFFKLRDKYNQTIVIVTHDKELAEMSDRKIILEDGMVVNNV